MVFLTLPINAISTGLEDNGWNKSSTAAVEFSATAPLAPDGGKLWLSTVDNLLSVFNGTAWQYVNLTPAQQTQLNLISTAVTDATAQANIATASAASTISASNSASASALMSATILNTLQTVGLDALVDVTILTPTTNHVISYDGVNWTNREVKTVNGQPIFGTGDISTTGTLNDLTDAVITTPISGQVLSYNGMDWVNTTSASGVTDHTLLTNIGTLTHAQIETALTGKQSSSADLTAIDALVGTAGILTKTATDTWALDTATYSTTAHTHTGVYEPADATILKNASIGVSVQAYDADLTSWAALAPSTKQDTLVSATNIKTVNGATLLGAGDLVVSDATKLPLTGGTMTGAITGLRETSVAVGANNIDLTAGNLFAKTISGATTLTVSGALASPATNGFFLRLVNGGSAVITWFSGVKWGSGTAPTLTAAGIDILGFVSIDGGTTYENTSIRKDVR